MTQLTVNKQECLVLLKSINAFRQKNRKEKARSERQGKLPPEGGANIYEVHAKVINDLGDKLTAVLSELNKQVHDDRHGSPYDRGGADSYYGRPYNPHYYKGATYSSDRVGQDDMTEQERQAYHDGYYDNEKLGDKKDWG